MTRDEIAVEAMKALVAATIIAGRSLSAAEVSTGSYKLADAMIKESNKIV